MSVKIIDNHPSRKLSSGYPCFSLDIFFIIIVDCFLFTKKL